METKSKGGPKTEEGKAISRFNALKHGLLSKEVLIAGEDENKLKDIREGVYGALEPVGAMESLFVDRIVSNVWRLKRALTVETSTMDWYQNDFDLFPIGQSDEQQERKSTKDILDNDSILHILRYETTIEKGIYKALHELERLQARRMGKEVQIPAVLDVMVDSSFGKNDSV